MAKDYRYLTPEEIEILKGEPAITGAELDAINELFAHYIIYTREKNGLRISTSCCHHRKELVEYQQRTETPELRELLTAKHGDYVRCPFCGKGATLRAEGKTTGRKWERILGKAVLLRATESGELYARAVYLKLDIRDLPWAPPTAAVASIYHFAPGSARQFWERYGIWYCDTERGALHSKRKVVEPFGHGGIYNCYDNYAVIGLEELDKSFLRWTDYGRFRHQDAPGAVLYDDLIRYLTVGSIYPRQLEMLCKAGQLTLINDLMFEGRKNAKIFRWEETDPRRAFGLNGQELRWYLQLGDALHVLHARKVLGCSLEHAVGWFDYPLSFDHQFEFDMFIKTCREYGADPEKARKYLMRFTGVRCHGGVFGLDQAARLWRDYLANAQAAGMDVRLQNILMPRDLAQAHENAAEIVRARERAKHAEEVAERERKARLRSVELNKLYGFETERYLIRAPKDGKEIVAEGNALRHCVGGYAQRHADGAATILFLRDKAAPDKPLATIEVRGYSVVQIHAYRNDHDDKGRPTGNPKLRFAEIYAPWQRWLNAGCPRKKDGTPRVPKGKKEAKTA